MPDHGNDPESSPPGRHRWFDGRYAKYRHRPFGAGRSAGLAGPPGRYLAIVALLVGTASLPLVAAISAGPVIGGAALGDTRPFVSPPVKGLVVVPPPPVAPPADDQPFAAGALVPIRWSDVPITPTTDQYGWRASGSAGPNKAVSDSGVRLPKPSSPPATSPTTSPSDPSAPGSESKHPDKPAPPPRQPGRSTPAPAPSPRQPGRSTPAPAPSPSASTSPSPAPPSRALPKNLAVSRLVTTWLPPALAPAKAPKA